MRPLVCGVLGVKPSVVRLSNICHGNPYVVEPATPLYQVVETMAAERYGAALVVQDQKLIGIFTTVDACRVLASVLKRLATSGFDPSKWLSEA